jgi:hypothetical protein
MPNIKHTPIYLIAKLASKTGLKQSIFEKKLLEEYLDAALDFESFRQISTRRQWKLLSRLSRLQTDSSEIADNIYKNIFGLLKYSCLSPDEFDLCLSNIKKQFERQPPSSQCLQRIMRPIHSRASNYLLNKDSGMIKFMIPHTAIKFLTVTTFKNYTATKHQNFLATSKKEKQSIAIFLPHLSGARALFFDANLPNTIYCDEPDINKQYPIYNLPDIKIINLNDQINPALIKKPRRNIITSIEKLFPRKKHQNVARQACQLFFAKMKDEAQKQQEMCKISTLCLPYIRRYNLPTPNFNIPVKATLPHNLHFDKSYGPSEAAEQISTTGEITASLKRLKINDKRRPLSAVESNRDRRKTRTSSNDLSSPSKNDRNLHFKRKRILPGTCSVKHKRVS